MQNPFRGVELDYGKGTTRPASREEAYALHAALVAAGELHLAAVPLDLLSSGTNGPKTCSQVISLGQTTVRRNDPTRCAYYTTKPAS